MISLFEEAGMVRSLPPQMVRDLVTRGSRSVSALSFVALDADTEPIVAATIPLPMDPALDAAQERAWQVAAMVDAAREDACQAAKGEMQQELAVQQERERARAERLTIEFARDRHRFFASAETQVIRLALAVAEKILAREVKCSALPLSAAVHAALARVQDDSATVLRVHPDNAEGWRALFVAEPRLTVIKDVRLATDDCMLETTIGRIELGIVTQMQEIEHGFDDLLSRNGH